MFRFVLVVSTLATAGLFVAAVFFCDGGPVGDIDEAGMDLYRKGQFRDALEVWRTGLEEYSDSSRLHYRVGTILAVRGSFERAERHLRRAVELSPDEPEIRKELGICYLQAERPEDAERELKTVVVQANWFPEAHYYLGTIYEKRGQHEAAKREYVEELNHNPSCAFAWAKVHAAGEVPPRRSRRGWLWLCGVMVVIAAVLIFVEGRTRWMQTVCRPSGS